MRKNENVAEKTAKSAESTSFRNDYDVSVINAVANLLQLTVATDSIVFEKRKCHRVFAEIPRRAFQPLHLPPRFGFKLAHPVIIRR